MFCHRGIGGRRLQFAKAGKDVNINTYYRTTRRTAPAQNISDGHQFCFEGSAACEGNELLREAVGLGVAVVTVDTETDIRVSD